LQVITLLILPAPIFYHFRNCRAHSCGASCRFVKVFLAILLLYNLFAVLYLSMADFACNEINLIGVFIAVESFKLICMIITTSAPGILALAQCRTMMHHMNEFSQRYFVIMSLVMLLCIFKLVFGVWNITSITSGNDNSQQCIEQYSPAAIYSRLIVGILAGAGNVAMIGIQIWYYCKSPDVYGATRNLLGLKLWMIVGYRSSLIFLLIQALIDFITQIVAISNVDLMEFIEASYSVSFFLQCCLLIIFCKWLYDMHNFAKDIEHDIIDMQQPQSQQQQQNEKEQNSVCGDSESLFININQNNPTLLERLTEPVQFNLPPVFKHYMEGVDESHNVSPMAPVSWSWLLGTQ